MAAPVCECTLDSPRMGSLRVSIAGMRLVWRSRLTRFASCAKSIRENTMKELALEFFVITKSAFLLGREFTYSFTLRAACGCAIQKHKRSLLP